MREYLITYDLIGENKDYQSLFDKIKEYGTWWHHLESVWIISTKESLREVRDNLTAVLDEEDKLLVVVLEGSWATYNINKRGTNWLKNNVSKTTDRQK